LLESIDDVDKKILEILRTDARVSIREIARKIGSSHSTIYDRIRKLERRGIISGYTIRINYKKLGYQITALILVNVDGRHIIEVEKWLAQEPNVLAVYDITGEHDIAVIASFKTIDELDSFIKNVLRNPYVKQTRTSIVFRKVKEEIHLPL